MKRIGIVGLFVMLVFSLQAQVIAPAVEQAFPGSWYCFRTTVSLSDSPRKAVLRIAADSKYWMWINGRLVVNEGGLKRGPNPKDTYCDVIERSDIWDKGTNTVAVLVWYFGKDGFSHRNSPTPGLTFDLSVNGKA